MTPFTDKAERQRVAALDADVRKLDTALAALTDRLDATTARRDALVARLAADLAAVPAPDEATDALAARLAAEPDAAIDDETAAHLRESRTAAAVKAHGDAGVEAALRQALTTVEADIVALDAAIAAGRIDRAHAWVAFVRGAHEALMGEFRQRWEVLARDVVIPLQELALLQGDDTPGRIIGGMQQHIAPESGLSIRGPGNERVYLLVAQEGGGGVRERHPEAVAALRAHLAA